MKVQIAYVDDWEGIYIDGKLKWEGHSLSLNMVLSLLKIPVEFISVDEDWLVLDNGGSLPEDSTSIKVTE